MKISLSLFVLATTFSSIIFADYDYSVLKRQADEKTVYTFFFVGKPFHIELPNFITNNYQEKDLLTFEQNDLVEVVACEDLKHLLSFKKKYYETHATKGCKSLKKNNLAKENPIDKRGSVIFPSLLSLLNKDTGISEVLFGHDLNKYHILWRHYLDQKTKNLLSSQK